VLTVDKYIITRLPTYDTRKEQDAQKEYWLIFFSACFFSESSRGTQHSRYRAIILAIGT
jgi:hypothetical protein